MLPVNLKALIGKLNSTTRAALEGAAGLCQANTQFTIEPEHFLLKLLDSKDYDFYWITKHFGVDMARLSGELNRSLDKLKRGNAGTPSFSPPLANALSNAWLYASLECNANQIRSGHVLAALVTDDDLRRLVFEVSKEIKLIDAAVLKRDFASIVQPSPENASEAEPIPRLAEPRTNPGVTGGPHVFISYRRNDSPLYVELLFKDLKEEVPDLFIFRDLDTLQPGMEFAKMINETVAAADFVLAVIGKRWAGGNAKIGTRINQPEDFVRLEIAAAFLHQKVVIPCLVGGAKLPRKEDLPPDLHALLGRNTVTLSDSSFHRDASGLRDMLKAWRRSTS